MVQSLAGISLPPVYGSTAQGGSSRQAAQIRNLVSSQTDSSSSTRQAGQLSAEEQRKVAELQKIDREVREHEQAHLRVGRDLVLGGPSYTYTVGPDQKRYAVGGEVSIDASPARTPEDTIPKAQHIRATALAPANPSAQDQRVAARAGSMENEARVELEVERRAEAAAEQSASTARQPGASLAANETGSGASGSAYRYNVAQAETASAAGSQLDVYA